MPAFDDSAPKGSPRLTTSRRSSTAPISSGRYAFSPAAADSPTAAKTLAIGAARSMGRVSTCARRWAQYDAPVIFDAHMHVGEFPLFDVRLDRDGLVALMAEHGYGGCVIFHPDNAMVAAILETVPDAWGLGVGQPPDAGRR